MIFNQVDQTYQILEDRWQDLADAFKRLSHVTDDAVQEAGLVELVAQCKNCAANAEAQINTYADHSAKEVIDATITFLAGSDGGAAALAIIQSGYIALAILESPEAQDCENRLEELSETIKDQRQSLRELKSNIAYRSNVAGIKDSVGNIAAYPILTSDVDLPPQMGNGGGGMGAAGSLQRLVDGAIRNVLGRLPRTSDTRSFMVALKQSFVAHETESRLEYTWVPRAYSGQTELGGGVSGAQASLYTRAQKAYEDIVPILDGIYSLIPAEDVELASASRAIVHEEIEQAVKEFGLEGGPRAARIDGLFASLLGEDETLSFSALDLPENCHLHMLQEDYGLEREQINTLEEEANVTQFIVLVDYIQSLRHSWIDFRTTWYSKDLGTRLVLLSRALTVSSEAVEEVCTAMDSVFVGRAERHVTFFRDDDGNRMLVEDLLSWITLFTSEEAPTLIHEGGKRGVDAIRPTAVTLAKLLNNLTQRILYDPSMPDGMRHPRVIHPLRELEGYLNRVVEIAEDTYAPMLLVH